MEDLYASLMAELASGGMTLPVTMELTLVARFYERLADHVPDQHLPLGEAVQALTISARWSQAEIVKKRRCPSSPSTARRTLQIAVPAAVYRSSGGPSAPAHDVPAAVLTDDAERVRPRRQAPGRQACAPPLVSVASGQVVMRG